MKLIFQTKDYFLGAIDLHWGSSEHAIEGVKGNAELQLHHFDPYYFSFEEALDAEAAVISISMVLKV